MTKKAKKSERIIEEPKLTWKMIKVISETAAKTAVEEYQKKLDQLQNTLRDKKLHNTKYLMKHYRRLSLYQENAKYELWSELQDEESENILELMGIDLRERLQVESIKKNVVTTKIIMDHVNAMLDVYRWRCQKSKKPEDTRKWNVVYMTYIQDEEMKPEEIADLENIDKRTVFKDINKACEELSTLIFGLDLSELWKKDQTSI